jgi:hypothetical protein
MSRQQQTQSRLQLLQPLLEDLKELMEAHVGPNEYPEFLRVNFATYMNPNISDQEALQLLLQYMRDYLFRVDHRNAMREAQSCCNVQKRGGEIFPSSNKMHGRKYSMGGKTHVMPDGSVMLNSDHQTDRRAVKYALGGMQIQPYPQPIRREYQPVYNVAGLGAILEEGATYLFGNATERMKRFMKEHGDEPIESITVGRVPLSKAIATAMSALTLGKFDKAKANKGYDDFFHLFYVINGKYRLEKNQNVNLIDNYKPVDNQENFNVDLGGLKGKTINEFIKNGEAVMGEKDYWGNYDGLVKNCQNWVMQNMKANGVYTQALKDFTFQDTQELIDEVNPYVKGAMKEVTSVASALDKFVSWLSGGRFGLKRGGFVR